MKKHSLAILTSAPSRMRNGDVEYPYRQQSNFFYLTGFAEADALALLIPGRKAGEFVMFCREFDPEKAIWSGHHAGLEGACQLYGADQAYSIDQLNTLLPEFVENKERVYFPIGRDSELDHTVMQAVNSVRIRARTGVKAPHEFIDLSYLLNEQRLFKTPEEIRIMGRAAEVSVLGHLRAMQACKPGRYEFEIEAELAHEFALHGMRSLAYPSIVATGSNACTLHYTENKDQLRDGELLLIDAGAEYQNYAADITRTFPVNGKFSEPQKLIYELVLDAQLAAIECVRPGRSWIEPHEAAVKVLTNGLIRLGLLEGKPSKLIKDGAYKRFYMHRTGHWLGMDVHDVGDYMVDGNWRLLEPGMVLTVEPGLYISETFVDVDPCWRGIGVRIEDDVLVTNDGCEILTAGLAKTVAEIEAVMAAT